MSGSSPPPGRKFFTPQQANATLPLVKKIIGDITSLAEEIQQRQMQIESFVTADRAISTEEQDKLADLQNRLENDVEKMHGFQQELTQLGILLKDYVRGLIDFPCWMDGREVYLCWHQGEDEVLWWHEIEAGFSGRQKISLTPGAFQ